MLIASRFNRKNFLGLFLSAVCVLGSPTVHANIIDNTHGLGAGSFELGIFKNNGSDFMELAPSATTITGWTVGGQGDGVDWLTTPFFGAQSGLHSVDLVGTSAGSVSTEISTTLGQTYELTFYAATVSTGTALGTVSAGSLVNQTFSAPITPSPNFGNQVFAPFSFIFTATGSTTTVSFTSSSSGCLPDCYGPVIDSVGVDLVSAVPEPSTIALLLIGGVFCARTRQGRRAQ